MGRTITIDPITRLEGHGRIEIFLDDAGGVSDCYFQIPELRGFERFVVGRPIEEVPRIVTRICGVCPASHHLAGAKAVDACFGGAIAPAAVKLREAYYCAHFLHSHIAHFYALAAPDFVCGPEAEAGERNILGLVARVGLETGRQVIGARATAQEIQAILGGRKRNVCWCVPGGVSKGLTEEDRARLKPMAAALLEFARFSVRLFKQAVLGQSRWVDAVLRGPYALAIGHLGLVDADGAVTFYDGTLRLVDCEGREIARFAPGEYADVIAEHVEPWTYLKFPFLRARGWRGFVEGPDSPLYGAGPLARLNVAERMATREAEEARQELFATLGGRPSGAMLGHHWARLVEMVFAAERLVALVADPELSSPEFRVLPDRITGEGVGVVEAMRGTLIHHYTCDDQGICTGANLIVGTTHNNAPIQMVTKKVATALIRPGVTPDAALLDRVEMAFRAFDPCYSCATHWLPGAMPLVARLHQRGRVVATLRRPG